MSIEGQFKIDVKNRKLKTLKSELDPDLVQVSLDDNNEENATPRDDLLTDDDIVCSPLECDQNQQNNENQSVIEGFDSIALGAPDFAK